jgi:hypothetical protein
MGENLKKPKQRRSIRLKGYDYASAGMLTMKLIIK